MSLDRRVLAAELTLSAKGGLVFVGMLSLCLGCGAAQDPVGEEVADEIELVRGLAYDLTLHAPENGGHLGVEMTLWTEPIPDPLTLIFPYQWAGRDAFFDDIVGIRATSERGECRVLRLESGTVEVDCGAVEHIRVSYDVAPRAGLLTEATRFYALSSADRFYGPGHAIFAQPMGVDSDLYDEIGVAISGQGDWQLHTSLGDARSATMAQLVNATFFGGAFDVAELHRDGTRVQAFVQRGVAIPEFALAEASLAIVSAQEETLGPEISERTVVVALLRDDAPELMTGNGREGGYVLELGERVDVVDDELVELIAHENLHRLNGHELVFAADDEFATLWFRKGVTDYLGVRSCVDAGVLSEERLFRHIGNALTMYSGNPVADRVSGTELSEAFWEDRDYRRLPYDKGSLIALVMDIRLRAAGHGGIGGFLRFLADDERFAGREVSNALIQDALDAYSGEDWSSFFDAYVHGTERLPVFEELNDIGLRVVERVEPAPYYGFRSNVTASGEWYISEVAFDSPASRSGLSEGMRLAAEPLVPDSLDGSAHLRVMSNGTQVDVTVRAGRGQRRSYAILSDHDGYRSALGLDSG